MDTRIKLKVLGLTYSQVQKGAYALVLAEENGPRRIPVVIGVSEAQSIAISLEGIVPPRPITHDLFVSFSHGFGIRLKEVVFINLRREFFPRKCFLTMVRVRSYRCRTSDAIAIALRTRSDIYVMQDIIDEAGFVYEENEGKEVVETEEHSPKKRVCRLIPVRNLKERLEKAIASEAYEEAARIQDELNKRDNNL